MMAKLGDIATYINGYAFKPQDWSDEGIPIIRIQDLTGNSYQANRYNGEYASKYEVNDGDVLISWSASLGVYIWHGEKAVLNQHIFKVVFDKERISKDFFVHQVGLILENAASDAHGATMKHLTKPVFDALPFYLPPYEKQCEIAEVLDKVTSLISLRKQQLAKLDELVKARFVEMFGEPVQNPNCWKTENLLDLGYCKNGMNFHRDDCGTEIHCLGVGDFKNHSTIRDVGSLPFISLNELPTSEYLLQDGDIVFVRSNGNKELVGRCLAIYPAKIPVTYSGFCIRYRLTSNKITVSYLLRVLKADSVRKKMTGRGANIQNLNQQILAQLVVPIPPLSLQNQFAAFVERVDQQKQTVQQGLEKLELMKKALMQEYFG